MLRLSSTSVIVCVIRLDVPCLYFTNLVRIVFVHVFVTVSVITLINWILLPSLHCRVTSLYCVIECLKCIPVIVNPIDRRTIKLSLSYIRKRVIQPLRYIKRLHWRRGTKSFLKGCTLQASSPVSTSAQE
jgi:hypothetical protein